MAVNENCLKSFLDLIIFVSVAESIELSVAILNAIKPSVAFEDINLLWEFIDEGNKLVTNKTFFQHDITEQGTPCVVSIPVLPNSFSFLCSSRKVRNRRRCHPDY